MQNSIVHIFFSLLLLSNFCLAQDDLEENVFSSTSYSKKDLKEEQKLLDFKHHFLEANKQKSIENYNKAIESLFICKEIFPNNVALLFELAKNHYALQEYSEAKYYCDKALVIEPDNFGIIKFLGNIYIQQLLYSEAILIQKNLYLKKPSEAVGLLQLYYKIKSVEKGKQLLEEIQKKGIPIDNINFFKYYFANANSVAGITKIEENHDSLSIGKLREEFIKNKDYSRLLLLLIKGATLGKYNDLLKDSATGLELFPVQATIYYYNGMALNALQKHEKAISILEEGLEYNIDNDSLLKQFYELLIIALKATNNLIKADYYGQLVQKL